MKAEIIGYVTGMINSYERTISQYKKDELPKEKYKSFDLVKEELSDLLDFAQDIPEETDRLNKRIAELEESCENMNDIEKNLHLQIKELDTENIGGQVAYQKLKVENQKLITQSKIDKRISIMSEKDNEDLRLDNIAWQKACKVLGEKNKYQEESIGIYEANIEELSVIVKKYKKMEEK